MRTKIQVLKQMLTASMLTLLLTGTCLHAQTKMGAFTKSYEYEYALNYKRAIETMTSVYDENSYEINLRLGWLQYQAGDFAKAVTYYKKAIAITPSSVEAHIGLSYPLSALGNDDDMIANYKEILKIDSNNTTANYWLAYIYFLHNEMDKAVTHSKKVLELYPFDYDANFLLGRAYVAQGKITEAKEVLTRALYYNPSSITVKDILDKL